MANKGKGVRGKGGHRSSHLDLFLPLEAQTRKYEPTKVPRRQDTEPDSQCQAGLGLGCSAWTFRGHHECFGTLSFKKGPTGLTGLK